MFGHRPIAVVLLLLLVASAGTAVADRKEKETRFAAEMAQKGNWREAVYRWERLLHDDPDNPRLLNNLAVAHETMGDYERARSFYQDALRLGSGLREIRENFASFQNFYERLKRSEDLTEPAVSGDRAHDDGRGADDRPAAPGGSPP